MKEKKYQIGEMSRLTGLSRDTLRFYEKKGVIAAARKENGYRYYSDRDLYRLMKICYHRNLDDSLADIEGIVSGCSLRALREHLERRKEEEELAIREHSRRLAGIRQAQRDLNAAKENYMGFTVRPFPRAYVLGQYASFSECMAGWFELLGEHPSLSMAYFFCQYSRGDGGESQYENTRILFYPELDKKADRMLEGRKAPVTRERDCIFSVVCSESVHPSEKSVGVLYDWGKRRGLELEPQFFCSPTGNFSYNGRGYNYIELYIPMRER